MTATSNIATTTAFKFAVATKRGGTFHIIATIKNGILCQSRLSTASEVTGEFVVTPFRVSGLREGYVWYSRCKTLYTRNRKVVDNVLFTGGEAETVTTKFIWYNDSYVERIPTSAYSNLVCCR